MEPLRQTKVTDQNRNDFYHSVYRVQSLPVNQLIDLNLYALPIVLVDSCGWYYRNCFPNKQVIVVEGMQHCKTFNLKRDQFDRLFDDRVESPRIPQINTTESVLVLDQSPILLKYRGVDELRETFNQLCNAANASILRIRLPLATMNDNRFQDRIKALVNLVPEAFITSFINYNTSTLNAEYVKKKSYEFSVN